MQWSRLKLHDLSTATKSFCCAWFKMMNRYTLKDDEQPRYSAAGCLLPVRVQGAGREVSTLQAYQAAEIGRLLSLCAAVLA